MDVERQRTKSAIEAHRGAFVNIPKSAIEWFVNRMHVSVSDEEVRADIRKRTNGVDPAWPEAKIIEAEEYAVKCHNKNRDLYRAVVSGRL